MTRVTLVRAWPRDPATGATIAVKLAGGGEIVPYPSGYRAGIIHEPRFSGALGFEQDGWSGGVVPNATAINFQPSDTALLDTLIGYYWTRAAIEIDVTEETAAPARRLTGIVASVSEREGVLSITAADLGHALAGPLATGTFAGTGGIEGVAAAEGRIKRRSWGRVFNVEGRLLDSVNNIYEFGDPSKKLQGCTALRDKGKAGALTILAWGGSIAATFAALQASVPPTGGGVFAPSIACAKWWTQPAGPLTADLLGEIGTGYVEKVAEIASAISAELGGPAISNLAAATALRPDAVGWHIDTATETGAAVLDKMLAGASLFWVLDPAGTIRIGEWTWSGAAEAVTGIYEGSDRQFAPHKSRKIGYYRNQHVHADGDIAADIPASSVLVGGVAIDTLIAQAQADADTALADLADIASDSLLTPDEKPRVIQDRDAIVAEQSGIDAQATAFSITTEKTTYDTAVSALTTYLATLTAPVLWSNLTGDTTIVGTTFRQKFLDVYAARQALLNKIAAEAAKRADWSLLNGVPYDEIFNSDDDVVLGFNPTFSAWSGLYPDNWSNWVGGAPTKETSIVRVGSNSVRMTAAGADRGIQCDAISFTSTPLPVGTFLSGAVDFYLAARTSGLPGILVRLYTNSAKSTFVDTAVQPGTTTGAWQRIPWTARVGAAQQIYGIRIYVRASWSAFASGSFTGDVIFGDVRFGLFDSSTDNKSVSINADGTLSGAGSGAVTITGLGYTGDLSATRNVVTYSATAPASPANGDLWVDTSGTFAVFKLRSGGAWVTGANALSAYNALSGKPVALADINTTESTKLSGIQAGATVGAPAGTNVGSTPAATVESGANKGNAGLDGSGNVLTNKVGTGSIVPNAVILPGYSGLASDYDVTTYNSWVDVLTSTATTIGASVDAGTSFSLIGLGTSPPSFAFAYCLVRLVVDGTILKDWIVSAYILDAATATANDIAFSGYERSYGTMHTPSAAAHTWKLQAYLDNTGGAWSAYSAKLRFLKGSNIKPAEYRR